MVGREIDVARPLEQPRRLADVRTLEVDGLTVAGDRGELAVKDVSFAIREGEIVGVAGVAGNGQRELAEAVSGMRDIRAGASASRAAACEAAIHARRSARASGTFPRTVSEPGSLRA